MEIDASDCLVETAITLAVDENPVNLVVKNLVELKEEPVEQVKNEEPVAIDIDFTKEETDETLFISEEKPADLISKEVERLLVETKKYRKTNERLCTEVKAVLHSNLIVENSICELEQDIEQALKESNLTEEGLEETIQNIERDIERFKSKGIVRVVECMEVHLESFKNLRNKIEKKNYLKWRTGALALNDILEDTPKTELMKEIEGVCNNNDVIEKDEIDSEICSLKSLIETYTNKNEHEIVAAFRDRLFRLEKVKSKISQYENRVNFLKEDFKAKWKLNPEEIGQLLEKMEKDSGFYKEHGIFEVVPILSIKQNILKDYRKIFSLFEPDATQVIKSKSFITVKRFSSESTSGWSYSGKATDAIELKISEDIIFLGIGIYRPNSSDSKIEFDFRVQSLQRDSEDEANGISYEAKKLELEYNEGNKIFQHFLKTRKILKKNRIYSFVLIGSGSSTYSGNSGKQTVVAQNINFEFSKSSLDGNGTSVESGQMPEFYFLKKK